MASERYTEEHEWVRVEGDIATCGISEYAQEQLGDVVFVDLPEIGMVVSQNDEIAVVESVKAASDIYAPVSGEVIEINGQLYKQYRGMGSHAAMKAGSAARYGHETKQVGRKVAAEGIEALKEMSGPLDKILSEFIGGIQSGMGYLGAPTLADLKRRARYIRVSPAGQRESVTHDVIEVKTPKEN